MNKKISYSAPDGAVGYITDVTQEHFYNEPDIGLYDELEQSCYELVCDFAELIGVHLDKSEQDCRLANLVRDFVGVTLEKEFGIPFPSYGESEQELAARLKKAKEAFERFENGVEPSKKAATHKSPSFNDNDECALALFNYLVSIGEAKPVDYDIYAQILHDINNLRGYEWLESLPRNTETEAIFAYLSPEPVVFHGDGAVLEDTFVFDISISPELYWEIATGEKGVVISNLDELRDKLDKFGLGEVWDYPMSDVDEAVENNEHLVIVEAGEISSFPNTECRIFEVTDEMLDRCQGVTKGLQAQFENPTHPDLNRQINDAAAKIGSTNLKEYELTLFQGEENEQIVRVMLTDEQAEIVCKNISGVETGEQNITLVGGSVLEVGCIDAIEILDGDSLFPIRETSRENEER